MRSYLWKCLRQCWGHSGSCVNVNPSLSATAKPRNIKYVGTTSMSHSKVEYSLTTGFFSRQVRKHLLPFHCIPFYSFHDSANPNSLPLLEDDLNFCVSGPLLKQHFSSKTPFPSYFIYPSTFFMYTFPVLSCGHLLYFIQTFITAYPNWWLCWTAELPVHTHFLLCP